MKLFTPITFRNVQLKNRIVMSPMCMYSAEDGVANDSILSITEAAHKVAWD